MNVLAIRNELVGAIGLALSVTALPLMSCAAHAQVSRLTELV